MKPAGNLCALVAVFTVVLSGCTSIDSKERAVTNPTNTLQFFVVSDDPVANGHYVNTPEFPKLGYIKNSPDLVIAHLQVVMLDTATRTIEYQGVVTNEVRPAVLVRLFPDDAVRFAKLTADYVGQQILIASDTRPLMAPRVLSPIDSGKVQISLATEKEAQNTATELKKLIRR